MSISTLSPGAVKALATRGGTSRTAFQSMLVAALHSVQRATLRVRVAEEAALSLAQSQKVADVVRDLEETESALRAGLDAQGECLLKEKWTFRGLMKQARAQVQASLQTPDDRPGLSWWYAFTEALEALEEAAAGMMAFADAQPAGTPAGLLGRQVTERFLAHHDALIEESDRWRIG